MPDQLHDYLTKTHVIFGCLGLIVFWIPIFVKKAGKTHIISGKIFAISAYIVSISAIISCLWALTSIETFLPETSKSKDNALSYASIHFFMAILGWIAVNVLVTLRLGLNAIETRKNPAQFKCIVNKTLVAILGLASIGLIILVITQSTSLGFKSRNWIAIALGALGLFQSFDNFRIIKNAWPTKMGWWYFHVQCMFTCGIAFHTAFFVFGLRMLIGSTPWMPVVWIAPTIIGITAIILTEKHYRKKFGEL